MSDLDPRIFEAAQKREVSNILAKLKEGKTLTNTERALLHELAPDKAEKEGAPLPLWGVNKLQSARLLGITKASFLRYEKVLGFPKQNTLGQYPLPEIRDWMVANGRGAGNDDEALTRREEQIALQNEWLRMRISEKQRLLVPLTDVVFAWEQVFVAAVVQKVRSMATLPPDLRDEILAELTAIPVEDYYRKALEEAEKKPEIIKS